MTVLHKQLAKILKMFTFGSCTLIWRRPMTGSIPPTPEVTSRWFLTVQWPSVPLCEGGSWRRQHDWPTSQRNSSSSSLDTKEWICVSITVSCISMLCRLFWEPSPLKNKACGLHAGYGGSCFQCAQRLVESTTQPNDGRKGITPSNHFWKSGWAMKRMKFIFGAYALPLWRLLFSMPLHS